MSFEELFFKLSNKENIIIVIRLALPVGFCY